MPGLISVEEAQRRLVGGLDPVGFTEVSLEHSHGLVLSKNILSPMDLPPFDNSQMDGFAVISGDIVSASEEHPTTLKVIGDIPAGTDAQITLKSGEAARITTGAPLPFGADLVIPVEDTDQATSTTAYLPDTVRIFQASNPGTFIRPSGQDIKKHQQVLSAGNRMRAQDVGLLAMLGISKVPVFRKPKVALLSSGDELVAIDEQLSPGKIHDANSYMLQALLERHHAEVIHLGIASDNTKSIQTCLDNAVTGGADLILTSAGVSVGAFDFVRTVIETFGKIEFWRVNIRPGKPIAFGNYKNLPIIGLPGNPVSAYIGFEVFVRLVLEKLAGIRLSNTLHTFASLAGPVESDGRESYLRCQVTDKNGELVAELTESHQGSGNLLSLVQANALLIVPSGVKSLPAGSVVEVRLFDV